MFSVANGVTRGLQKLLMLLIHLNVSEGRKVITRLQTIEMSFQISAQGSLCRGAFQCGSIPVIGKQLDAVAVVKRCLRRQRSGALVLVSKFARFDLAGFDVGLIERIDADDRT